jgi:glycosyltransferase involved in cell wall biosynthesis
VTTRPAIAPVPDGVVRPLWSVMIPTFNCAATLAETLRSVLAQDPGPDAMQVEVVDDRSTRDDPEAVVRAVGAGRVAFHRQRVNLGVPGNLTDCLRRSRGHYVHVLHGDDSVLPGYYAAAQALFESGPGFGAVFCRAAYVDDAGRTIDAVPLAQERAGLLERGLEYLAAEQRIMTPAISVRREAYEALGGFDERLRCSEDWEMWIRIAARYPVGYLPDMLARYRIHDGSHTARSRRSGDDLRYTALAIDLFGEYLPPARRAHLRRVARRRYAQAAARSARHCIAERDWPAAWQQARVALALRPSPSVALHLGWSVLRGLSAASRRGVHP